VSNATPALSAQPTATGDANTPPPDIGRHTTLIRALLTFLAIAAVIASYAFILQDARTQALKSAQDNLRSIAFALAQRVDRTLEQADQVGRIMRNRYTEGGQFKTFADALYRELDQSLYTQLGIIERNGFSSYSSVPDSKPVDLSDRKHFRVHADGSGADTLYISSPVLGRVSKKLTIQLSRRISAANGAFAGVTVVSINPEQFTGVFRELIGTNGLISLTGLDGINRIRVDREGFRFGQDLSNQPWFKTIATQNNGFVDVRSSVDGQLRLTAFQQLPNRGLYVTVGMPYDEIDTRYLAGYHQYLPWLTGLVVVILMLLFALSIRSKRLTHRLQKANVALADSIRMVTEATEAKTRFLASISHELRTPLHGILGHSQLLTLSTLPSDADESAKSIFQSAEHLLKIVNQLLDLSKAEGGGQQLLIESVDLRLLLGNVVALHRGAAGHLKLGLAHRVDDNVPAFIETDRTALTRILHNLLSNALKFTDAGTVQIHVTAARGQLRFEVTDSGIGIAAEDQKTLFTSYTQLNDFSTRRAEGTGLGLALTRNLVTLLGGEIGVISEPGKGSRFWFTLPALPGKDKSTKGMR